MKTEHEINVFLTRFMFSLETFLLFYTTLLKCFMLSKITVSFILHGATISALRTMNWGKVISIHLTMIRRKFTFFQIIYYLRKRKICLKKNHAYLIHNYLLAYWWKNHVHTISLGTDIYSVVKHLTSFGWYL